MVSLPEGLRNALSDPLIAGFLGFFLGLSAGLVVATIQTSDLVEAEVYVCTYSATDPQSELLKGVFCRAGNATNDPCPFDLYTKYGGKIRASEQEIERVNEYNSRNPNGTEAKWNLSIVSKENKNI